MPAAIAVWRNRRQVVSPLAPALSPLRGEGGPALPITAAQPGFYPNAFLGDGSAEERGEDDESFQRAAAAVTRVLSGA